MSLKKYIEIGAKKAGSLTALGKMLDISQPNISNAKAEKKGISLEAAIKLADYIGADRMAVIAANELATEKKAEKKAFWASILGKPEEKNLSFLYNTIL